jgi:hypothetical protein
VLESTALDLCGDAWRRVDLRHQPVEGSELLSREATTAPARGSHDSELFQQHEGHVVVLFWTEVAKKIHIDVALVRTWRVVSFV